MRASSEADRIRNYSLDAYIKPARARGDTTIRIVVGDVHSAMDLRNRVPAVCSALKTEKFLTEGGLTLEKTEGPPSGQGTRVAFTYRFRDSAAPVPEWAFLKLRGIAKEIFSDLGGGETFIRKEREQFSSSSLHAEDKR